MFGDGRSRVIWKTGDQRPSLGDWLFGRGKVTAAHHGIAIFTIETFFCGTCKKMIFDTEIAD